MTAKEAGAAGYPPAAIRAAGYTTEEVAGALKEVMTAGLTASQAHAAGFTHAEMELAGYPPDELATTGNGATAAPGVAQERWYNDAAAAILKLKKSLEVLQKREDHLARKIENEIKQAKEFSARGKNREALTCIKRKEIYEEQCVGALELSRPHACSRLSRSLGRTGWTRS